MQGRRIRDPKTSGGSRLCSKATSATLPAPSALEPLFSDATPGFSEMRGTRRDQEPYAHVSADRASACSQTRGELGFHSLPTSITVNIGYISEQERAFTIH